MRKYNLRITTKEEMSSLGLEISRQIYQGTKILLHGDLGAGKTFLAKAIISHKLGIDVDEISSPTFTILNEYNKNGIAIHHYDLYRVTDTKELLQVGFFDYLDEAAYIIEWPDVVEKFLSDCGKIAIIDIVAYSDNSRDITIRSDFLIV